MYVVATKDRSYNVYAESPTFYTGTIARKTMVLVKTESGRWGAGELHSGGFQKPELHCMKIANSFRDAYSDWIDRCATIIKSRDEEDLYV